jgi:hypothetical protein
VSAHRAIWDALDRAGCRPHGPEHDFRARCPGHDGENRDALHVSTGADGRVLLTCFAHDCDSETIVGAIGLEMSDLFPPGHHRARRLKPPRSRREDFTGPARTVVNVLAGLETVGSDWCLELRTDCPHCGSPAALLQASPRFVLLSCPGDEYAERLGYTACTLDQFQQALAGRVNDQRSVKNERRAA